MMTEIGGLHVLYWIFSALIPLLLLVLGVSYLILAKKATGHYHKTVSDLEDALNSQKKRGMFLVKTVAEALAKSKTSKMASRFSRMQADSQLLHRGQWLPDPNLYLQPEQVLSPAQQVSVSFRPASRVFGLGLLSSLVVLLLQQQYTIGWDVPALGLILLPLGIAVAMSLILAAEALQGQKQLRACQQEMNRLLARHLPVYGDQAGMSLLIDEFMTYDRRMQESLQLFSETAQRLTESDMADGIRRSVEQVLLESVAPCIEESTAVLKDLAGELAQRQEQGMEDLAGRFATALSSDLSAHLRPVNKEISQMSALMADVKNYIEYAMRALETVRNESESLLEDTRESLSQMAEARQGFSQDFGQATEHLEKLTAATSHMADLQQNNEKGLSGSIQNLSQQLERHSQELKVIVDEAMEATRQVQETAAEQEISAEEYVASIESQVQLLSRELQGSIEGMLTQIGQETSSVARHATEIGSRLGSLNETLSRSLDDFSQESAQYVKGTLHQFDESLAELVNRLTQATAEIRDAVDALPAATQQRPSFDS